MIDNYGYVIVITLSTDLPMIALSLSRKVTHVMENSNLPSQKLIDQENTLENTTKISKSLLKQLVKKELDYTEIISNNKELSQEYNYLVKSYGFNSFLDLYTYADSCDSEYILKGGQKDLSKLKRVTRTVMRNGKPMKTTIYEDSGGGDDDKNPMDSGGDNKEVQQPRHANDLQLSLLGMEEENIPPKQVAQLANQAKHLQGAFNTDCNVYAVLTGDTGDISGIAGFRIEKGYLRLVFTQQDSLTSGVTLRAFHILTIQAWKKGLGAILNSTENETALALFKEYGFKKQGDVYKVSASGLKKLLGTP